jgi:hypothetical protein
MNKIGRNDPCPCGSGKKFKHCHLGREDEIFSAGMEQISPEISSRITTLPQVDYGRAREMVQALDIAELTGSPMGIRFIDLRKYLELDVSGYAGSRERKHASGGVFVNLLKTQKTDPHNLYVAISPKVEDGLLVHQIAHVLHFLKRPEVSLGLAKPLAFDLGLPVEHLEHPHEFGYWLEYLSAKFDVQLDADDTIVLYLYRNGMLIKAEEIEKQDRFILKSRSDQILKFLSERGAEVDSLICELPGYIGSRVTKD